MREKNKRRRNRNKIKKQNSKSMIYVSYHLSSIKFTQTHIYEYPDENQSGRFVKRFEIFKFNSVSRQYINVDVKNM